MLPPVQPFSVPPVSVTAALASARPLKAPAVPTVAVMAAPARMVPLKFEVVIVTACATHQVTLQGLPPPAMTTEKPVPVRAPVPLVPILNSQVSVEVPSSVNVVSVNVAPAGKQMTPGLIESAWPVKAA